VHAAARQGRFLQLLAEYSGRFPDFSFLQSPSGSFQELGLALRAASTALESGEFVTAGVYQNGYCLALALVLEAMRQKFPAHLTTSDHI
jgi:hypothetical protein